MLPLGNKEAAFVHFSSTQWGFVELLICLCSFSQWHLQYLPSRWDKLENIQMKKQQRKLYPLFLMCASHGPVLLSDHSLRLFSISPTGHLDWYSKYTKGKRHLQWYCIKFVSPQVNGVQWTLIMDDFLIVAYYTGDSNMALTGWQTVRIPNCQAQKTETQTVLTESLSIQPPSSHCNFENNGSQLS